MLIIEFHGSSFCGPASLTEVEINNGWFVIAFQSEVATSQPEPASRQRTGEFARSMRLRPNLDCAAAIFAQYSHHLRMEARHQYQLRAILG
jgi:hypothetical protein